MRSLDIWIGYNFFSSHCKNSHCLIPDQPSQNVRSLESIFVEPSFSMDQDKTDVPVARVRCTHVYYSVFKCYATDTRFSFLLLMSIVFKASKFRNRISFFSAYHCTVKTNALKKRVVVLIGKIIFFTIS